VDRRRNPQPSLRLAAAGSAALLLLLPGVALAHGGAVLPAPTPLDLVFGWTFDPLVWLPVLATALAWRWAVRRVDRGHPANPVPRRRSWFFYAGLAVLLFALDSGVARYDDTLFSAHMVQHLLITLVAAPLILLGAPVTLALRAATPAFRRRVLLPVLHSRIARALSFPPVTWVLFTAVMWGTHFSPLFDLALENDAVHRVEHLLYLVAALLFWWPVVGADPMPWRIGFPGRLAYTFLQMPQNTFLALAIYSASAPLYHHYATLTETWLPDRLADQQAAGGIMWLGGYLLFLASLLLLTGGWLRADEKRAVLRERQTDVEVAAIRRREATLAARRSHEAGEVTD